VLHKSGGSALGGDPNHIKFFANAEAAAAWFVENHSEGVAFEYCILD